jgi:cytochrome c556
MKRSELKEAIKAEIKSVLTEEFQVGDIVMLTRGDEELEVIDKRRMLGLDLMAYTVRFPDGNTEEYSAGQLKPAQDDINIMNEGKKGVVVDPDEIKFHLDQFYGGNIDGNDLANAIEEILSDMMKRSVSFSDIREEDEPTDAEIKKADSVASAANKLQKLVKKMKDKAKDFKAAEGKAKEKIKDELKAMTAEKKKLEKAL